MANTGLKNLLCAASLGAWGPGLMNQVI